MVSFAGDHGISSELRKTRDRPQCDSCSAEYHIGHIAWLWVAELGLPSNDVEREDAPHVSSNEEEKTEASKETVE